MSAIPDSSAPQRPWVPFLLVALCALFAHGLSLRADFYMDDKPHILLSDRIQEGLDAPAGFKSRHLTYAIWRGVHLAFGQNAVAYHAVNLLLHLGVCLLFLPVARRVLGLHPGLDGPTRESVAFWGTVLFAVHPLVSEPVNYAAQTSMLLLSFFGTWATYLFLRWHESKRSVYLALTAFAVLLASHAKEPGIFHAAIPLFFLGALVVCGETLKRTLATSVRARLAVMGVAGAATLIFVCGWMLNAFKRVSDPERFLHHALTQSRVLFAYLWRVVYPGPLSSDHHIPWTTSWSDLPAVLALLCAVAAGVAVLYFTVRRRSWMAAVLGIALYHLLIRFAYPVDELMVEYRVYPSMPWIGLLLALLLTRALAWRGGPGAKWNRLVFGGLTTICVLLSAARSTTWSEEDRLATDVIRRYPHNLRAWSIHLGILAERGEFEQLVRLRNLPQEVAMSLVPRHAEKRATRQFTGEKTYTNYIACQYPLIKGLIHTGHLEEALRRADILLVDVLTKSPSKNHKSVFTVVLAKLLCHSARGEGDRIDRTIEDIRPHYDDEWELRRHLATEAASLPVKWAAAPSGGEDD